MSRYQIGKTNVDFTEARDSEWQWHQLGHMQVCNSLQTYTPAHHHSVFTGRMPFLPPNQQRQSTEGKLLLHIQGVLIATTDDWTDISVIASSSSTPLYTQLLLLLLHPFIGLFSRTTWVSRYQKGKTSLDLNDARDNRLLGWQ